MSVTEVIFLTAVNPIDGDTLELNCHPVGGATFTVTLHEPVTLPKSRLAPSFTVIVPNVVHRAAGPVAA